jgi:hypothetical protein
MSVSVESDFASEEGREGVKWAFVRGCDARDLVAAVSRDNGVITVLDAVTGNKLSESQPAPLNEFLWCVAASQFGRRVLVATGHYWKGMVRVRQAYWSVAGPIESEASAHRCCGTARHGAV